MKELTKEKRINEELEILKKYFEAVDENQRTLVSSLLQNAAFMKVTLEDLQEIINAEGVTEVYQNGANQHGMKQSATLQSYNSLIKNYASVIKTLSHLLPPERKPNTFTSFLNLQPKEKTEEELEAERQREEEHQRQLKGEIDRAIEYQRQQREKERAGIRV